MGAVAGLAGAKAGTGRALGDLDQRDHAILDGLRQEGQVSGQALADRLGFSRVALWKRIEGLKTLGYRIEGSHAGYRLVGDDAISPTEFHGVAPVRAWLATGSTMDEAARWAEAGAVSGSLVIADRQEQGRGQHGRAWLSPPGGLYLTLILRPRLPQGYAGSLILETGAWLSSWIEGRTGKRVELQWPNDLVQAGHKLGGILVESLGSPDSPRWFTVGIGLNMAAAPRLGTAEPTSLAELAGAAIQRRELARALQAHLEAWSRKPELRPAYWESRSCLASGQGRAIRLEERPELARGPGGQRPARALGFNRQGGLRLEGWPEAWVLPGELERVHWPAEAGGAAGA